VPGFPRSGGREGAFCRSYIPVPFDWLRDSDSNVTLKCQPSKCESWANDDAAIIEIAVLQLSMSMSGMAINHQLTNHSLISVLPTIRELTTVARRSVLLHCIVVKDAG
jgi:hypothetical protein